jgi:hypothetical protein
VARRRIRFDAPSATGHHRLGIIPGRRFAVALSVCLGLLVHLTGAAVADNGSGPLVQATIYKAGGGTATDSVSQAQLLAAPGQCPPYSGGSMQEYGRQGEVTVTPSSTNGWTVGTILGCLQTPISVADVTGITILGTDGSPETSPGSELTPADLASPSDFQATNQNPVIQALGSTDQYDRPWRGGSDLDFLDEAQSSPIAMEIFEGPPLTVTASPSQATVTAGGTVNFSAAVSGNDGSALSYSWSFDGGAPASTQPDPQVQFNTAGVWTVNLQVTDANGGGGGDQLTVTVNPASPTSTTTPTGTRTTGPTTSPGTTPGATPGTKRHGTTNPGSNGHRGQGSNTNAKSGKRKTSPHHRRHTKHTTSGNTGSGRGSSGTGHSGGGSSGSAGASGSGSPVTATTPATTTPKPKAPPAPTHRPSPTPPPGSPGPLVRGLLISDVIPLPASQSPLVHVVAAPSATAPARQSPRPPSVLPIVGAGLAVVLLLGLGAGRELRGPRRRRVMAVGA